VPSRRLLGAVDLPAGGQPYFPDTWVSPDGTLGATIRGPEGPVIIDVGSRKVLRRLRPLPASADPQFVVVQGWTARGDALLISRKVSDRDSEVLLVDATTGVPRFRVQLGSATAVEVAVDPRDRFVALGLDDGSLLVLDTRTGRALSPRLRAIAGDVLNVSISPDGRYIAASGHPAMVAVWDSRTLQPVATPLPVDVDAALARTRFSRDGHLLIVSGRVLREFTIDPVEWVARACREAGRTLTEDEFVELLPDRPYAPACT